MSRRQGSSRGRAWWSRFRPRPSLQDPGERWVDEILRPLGREEADCDVASRVMARIAAEGGGPLSAAVSPPPHRLAWVSSLTLACASLAFLVAALLLLVTGGDEGVRQIVGMGLSCWHVVGVFGRVAADFASRVLEVVLPILRAIEALLEVAAPLLRGAGLVAAAGGVASIAFSAYVFASARKTAPRVNFQGDTR
ncbi:MAG TPA: hypothetical protein VKF61_10760 [Candidatus Polarisedimenticolia bacterium]|nr:hypothetical protein [Candidatus Polarisedimenticolia bacterium]